MREKSDILFGGVNALKETSYSNIDLSLPETPSTV